MGDEERRTKAIELIHGASQQLTAADMEVDTVEVRRRHVLAAKRLRMAANLLDDEGRLEL